MQKKKSTVKSQKSNDPTQLDTKSKETKRTREASNIKITEKRLSSANTKNKESTRYNDVDEPAQKDQEYDHDANHEYEETAPQKSEESEPKEHNVDDEEFENLTKSLNITEKVQMRDDQKFTDPSQKDLWQTEGRQSDEASLGQRINQLEEELQQPQRSETLSLHTIKTVQHSWGLLIKKFNREKICLVLFKNIFKLAPEALQLFPFKKEANLYESEMFKTHSLLVVNTLEFAITKLTDFKQLEPILLDLGLKHAKFGVNENHYPILGRALLNTLKAGLRDSFDKEVSEAWIEVINTITNTMIRSFLGMPDILNNDLTEVKINIIQDVWQQASSIGVLKLMKLVFTKMFEIDPDLLTLFGFKSVQAFLTSAHIQKHLMLVFNILNSCIQSLPDLDSLKESLRTLGANHIERSVTKEDYHSLGAALIFTLQQVLGQNFTFQAQHAYQILYETLMEKVIANNYEEIEICQKLYHQYDLKMEQIDEVIKIWRRAVKLSPSGLGDCIFKHIIAICPDMPDLFEEYEVEEEEVDEVYEQLAAAFVKLISNFLVSFNNPKTLYNTCTKYREKHDELKIQPEHHVIIREGILMALSDVVKGDMTESIKFCIKHMYNTVRNMIMGYDVDERFQDGRVLTRTKLAILLQSWKLVKTLDPELVGYTLFEILFRKYPHILQHFPFKDQKNYLQSASVKKQTSAIVGLLGRCIESMVNFDNIVDTIIVMGEEHIERNIGRAHYDTLQDSICLCIAKLAGPHWDPIVKNSWEIAYFILTEKMLRLEAYNHHDNIDLKKKNDVRRPSARLDHHIMDKTFNMDDTMAPMNEPEIQNFKTEQFRQAFGSRFNKEVDFHHKVAYRFEKAYRLCKKEKYRQKTLNLEIITCISEYQTYIEKDHMTLFYLLFFCIYYKNVDLIEYLRSLVSRIPPIDKINQLLELIDTNGIDRIRTVGEQVNQYVYHMVFYQAVDDDLKIVYSSILKQLRLIQLRDKDALTFLNNRDYEIIELCFGKIVVKINVQPFGYPKSTSFICHSYRKYNQAFFEEIVINYVDIEPRVAQNFRERFISSPEDIRVVFEMYCKEDHVEEFMRTQKDNISHQQFVELFVICIRNDSFQIAMVIYLNYINVNEVMNEKMVNQIITSLKDSPRFHEFKLYFIHEVFDKLNVIQMNRILDIYQRQLHTKAYKKQPVANQFNTVKISLLIYRTCWRIKKRRIYSLQTKCSIIEEYLNKSLCKYFNKQNNILILQRMMLEPMLHYNEHKDCLDIMIEMDMKELLQHPVVMEVLNLIHEGKYSITTSPLSISYTFQCLLDMEMLSLNSINERFTKYIFSFGEVRKAVQSAIQYNIWKQNIYQRQNDEMILTSLFAIAMIFTCFMQILEISNIHEHELLYLGGTISKDPLILASVSGEKLRNFCQNTLQDFYRTYSFLQILSKISVFLAMGMLSNLIQKLTIFKIKNNVKLDIPILVIEFTGLVVGILYNFSISQPSFDSTVSDNCLRVISVSDEQKMQIDKVFSLSFSEQQATSLKFSYIVSFQVIQLVMFQILMLERTKSLGEAIMMLRVIINEMVRFFSTFGIIIVIYLVIGQLLGRYVAIDVEESSYWNNFHNLFNAMNGSPEFTIFTNPDGQFYILSFLMIFRIMLLSLLVAMYINKYRRVFVNLDAIKRYSVIQLKNTIEYDEAVGAVTCSFFPINIFVIPFLLPVVLYRSEKMSEVLLKVQFSLMSLIYTFMLMFMMIPVFPILYIKIIINSTFIMFANKRQKYMCQNFQQLCSTVFLGPAIIGMCFLIDLFQLPTLIMKSEREFEHKYQQIEHALNPVQTGYVEKVFNKMFKGLFAHQFLNKSMSLLELMKFHRKAFGLIESLHDLVCRGTKDYKMALNRVYDYNMTKILSKQSSFPDMGGDLKESRVEVNVMYSVQFDITKYNFIESMFRRIKMGVMQQYLKSQEKNHIYDDTNQAENEYYYSKKEQPKNIGPDGKQLLRDPFEYMGNFWITKVVESFTDVEEILKKASMHQRRRQARIAMIIEHDMKKMYTATIENFKQKCRDYRYLIHDSFTLPSKYNDINSDQQSHYTSHLTDQDMVKGDLEAVNTIKDFKQQFKEKSLKNI